MEHQEAYTTKFKELIRMCGELKAGEQVVIHHPQVLGDEYAEIVESLNRIADAELVLRILPRKARGTAKA